MVDHSVVSDRSHSSVNLLIGCLIVSVLLVIFPGGAFAGLALSVLVGLVVWLRRDLRDDWRFRIITFVAIAWNVAMLIVG